MIHIQLPIPIRESLMITPHSRFLPCSGGAPFDLHRSTSTFRIRFVRTTIDAATADGGGRQDRGIVHYAIRIEDFERGGERSRRRTRESDVARRRILRVAFADERAVDDGVTRLTPLNVSFFPLLLSTGSLDFRLCSMIEFEGECWTGE